MYKLYLIPGACSLATQVVLRELDQPVELIERDNADNLEAINPVDTVPVLTSSTKVLREGAGILLPRWRQKRRFLNRTESLGNDRGAV